MPFLLTRNASPPLPPTTLRRMMLSTPPMDPSGKSSPRLMPLVRGSTTTLRATRLWRPFRFRCPTRLGRGGCGRSRFGCRGRRGCRQLFRTKRLPRTSLRSPRSEPWSPPIRTPGLECENRFPLIKLPWNHRRGCPARGCRGTCCPRSGGHAEPNTPIPSPSGAMLSLPELSRTRLRADSLTTKPNKVFSFEEMSSTRLSRALTTQDAVRELAHRAVLHRDAIVAVVEHPDVAELVLRAVRELGAVAVDPVAVQIEGDVIGADHDPVVGAVDEVAVERRVGGDRVTALRLLVRGLGPAQRQEADQRQGQYHREQDERRRAGVGAKLG